MLLGLYFTSLKDEKKDIEVKSHAFLYKFDFKHYTNRPDLVLTDYILINKKGDTTFTQFYNQMKRDSIYSYRKMSGQERFENRINGFPHSIKTIKNTTVFTAKVADQYFQYEEQLDLNWKITKDIRKIGTYNCQFATVNYGGRIWNAWFTKDIPIDVGPYKFKGLPGCIVEISDSDEIFKYTLVRHVDKKVLRLEHYPFVAKKTIEKTTRKAFNKHQQAYEALGFEQRMAYLRRDQAGSGTIKLVSRGNDGIDLTKIESNETDKYQFLEIDHIE